MSHGGSATPSTGSHGNGSPFDLNVASLSFAIITLGTVLGLTLYNKHVTNRISFRLQAAIAIADIGNHLAGMYYAALPSGGLCTLAGFWRTFGRDLFCFYNLAIALNLQLVFLHKFTPKFKANLAYWLVPLFAALLMNIPPLALGMFGRDPKAKFGVCFIQGQNEPGGRALTIININTVLLLTFAYCTIVSVLVISKLRSSAKSLTAAEVTGDDARKKSITKELKSLVFRVALYPIVTIITLSGYLVLQFVSVVNPAGSSIEVSNWSIWTSNLAGTLNFIAFLFDPTLHFAAISLYKDVVLGKSRHNAQANNEFSNTDNKLDVHDSLSTYAFYQDEECKKVYQQF